MGRSSSGPRVSRRALLAGSAAMVLGGALGGCASRRVGNVRPGAMPAYQPTLDRLLGVTVCSRPFRAAGPRIEPERIGAQRIVHCYGHGGSGWSLSWGAAELATRLALEAGERDVGVVGCGAIGLTTALQLQRAGAAVTIYAREMPPDVPSSLAAGVWSPGSRIGFEGSLSQDFRRSWQSMTRASWRTYRSLLGLPGAPVEFVETFGLGDVAPEPRVAGSARAPRPDGRPHFAELDRELVPEIGVRAVPVDAAATPFAVAYVRRGMQMIFNLPAYTRLLIGDFRAAGGRIVIDELRSPQDFARLPHRTLVNATGMGARELLGDTTLVPVRGQLAHMVPEPGVRYGVQYRRVGMVSRRDGIVLQVHGDDDYFGFGDPSLVPDAEEAALAINTIAAAFRRPSV